MSRDRQGDLREDHPLEVRDPGLRAERLRRLSAQLPLLLRALHEAVHRARGALGGVRRRQGQRTGAAGPRGPAKKKGRVWVSGVCDAYQPLEAKFRLTRRCLEILVDHDWPVTVQTKSPLVLRDLEILKRSADAEVGLTITTADERLRKIFEPGAPPLVRRIEALGALHAAGIPTFVMVAPLLPHAGGLAGLLAGKVDRALIDRYNYHYADRTYKEQGLQSAMTEDFYQQEGEKLRAAFEQAGIPCRML